MAYLNWRQTLLGDKATLVVVSPEARAVVCAAVGGISAMGCSLRRRPGLPPNGQIAQISRIADVIAPLIAAGNRAIAMGAGGKSVRPIKLCSTNARPGCRF